MKESSKSDSNHDFDLDISAKQEIRSLYPQEKPSRKKRSVGNISGTISPALTPRLATGFGNLLLSPKWEKDEFSEGPCDSNINLSKEKRTTGCHEMNAIDIAID